MKLSDATDGYPLFKSTRASPTTIKTDRVLLGQFIRWLGDRDVQAVAPEDIGRFLGHYNERGLSPYTVRRHLAAISAPYRWLFSPDVALVGHNPASSVPAPRLPRLKPKALLAACQYMQCKRRVKALILFLPDTGARASEVASVKVTDADFSAGRVRVMGKGSRERTVYLGRRTLSALRLYVKDERPEPARVDEHLLLTDEGYPLDRDSLRRIVYRLAARAGVKASPHQFRHTSAIEHLRHGMDSLSLQRLLGHESLEITRGYLTPLSDEDIGRAANRTSPADNLRL